MSYNWARTKSRQPVAGLSSRTPAFQPPSFYAAAAGRSYPEPSQTNYQDNAEPTRSHNTNGTSIMYPTAEGDPEDEVSETRRKRASSLSRTFSRATPKTPREKEGRSHERKKSQMVEIPFLEAQLLPSLRDTIQRMTHPPRPAHQGEDAPASQDYHHSRTYEEQSTTDALLVLNGSRTGRSPVISPGYTPVSSLKPPGSRPFASPGLASPSDTAYASPSQIPKSPGRSLRSAKSLASPAEPSPRLSPAVASVSPCNVSLQNNHISYGNPELKVEVT